MINLDDLIYFMLAVAGITNILIYGKIFDAIRPRWHFFTCSMCVGFWIGIFLTLLTINLELFTFSDDTKELFFLLLTRGGIGSLAAYVYDMIIGDKGIRYEQTKF